MKPRTKNAARKPDDDSGALAALMGPMLKKRLFVILSAGGAQPEAIRRHLVEHLRYMIELERAGVLFASGPFAADGNKDARPGDGLTIVRADSLTAATAIAERDPFVRHGARSFTVREWTVNEGSMSVKVNLSDQSIEIA